VNMKRVIVTGLIYAFLYEFLLKGVLHIDGGLVVWVAVGVSFWLSKLMMSDKKSEENVQIKEEIEKAEPELKQMEKKTGRTLAFVISVFLVPIVIGLVVFGDSYFSGNPIKQEQEASYSASIASAPEQKEPTNNAKYYKKNYPMTWGYINKNYQYPDVYVDYYDRVWGRLQSFHGDGIVFDTLTSYEQSLVEYPSIKTFVYFANEKTTTYHSTTMCYTLLKSQNTIITRNYGYIENYDPCSKCVGDTQHVNKVRRMNGYK